MLGLLVKYRPSRQDGLGRKYAPQGCQMLPRRERLQMFAGTHTEYDIRACHASILHCHAGEEWLTHWPETRSAGTFREWVQQIFRLPEQDAKAAVQRLVSMTEERFYRWAAGKAQGNFSSAAVPFLQAYARLKHTFLAAAIRQQRVPAHAGRKNALYFALEAIEAELIWAWVANLQQQRKVVSLVVLGDAIMVHNGVPSHVILQAFAEEAAQRGLSALQLQQKDLPLELREQGWDQTEACWAVRPTIDGSVSTSMSSGRKRKRRAVESEAFVSLQDEEEEVTVRQAPRRQDRSRKGKGKGDARPQDDGARLWRNAPGPPSYSNKRLRRNIFRWAPTSDPLRMVPGTAEVPAVGIP
jgi:hypothetical protein